VADRSQATARRTDRDRVLESVGGLAGVHVRTERPVLVRIAVWHRWGVHSRRSSLPQPKPSCAASVGRQDGTCAHTPPQGLTAVSPRFYFGAFFSPPHGSGHRSSAHRASGAEGQGPTGRGPPTLVRYKCRHGIKSHALALFPCAPRTIGAGNRALSSPFVLQADPFDGCILQRPRRRSACHR
jgi:hypothetical protein